MILDMRKGEVLDGGTLRLDATILDRDETMGVGAEDSGLVWTDDEAEQLGISAAQNAPSQGAHTNLLSKQL